VWTLIRDDRCTAAVAMAERNADDPDPETLRAAYELAMDAVDEIAAPRATDDRTFRASQAAACSAAAVGSPDFNALFFGVEAALAEPAARPEIMTIVRDIFGNPFRPVVFSPQWRTDTAVALARQMYESRDFGAMPILADALQDAVCDSEDILSHCRCDGPHVRGCWALDLVLGKE
jgi:hypothetical protein